MQLEHLEVLSSHDAKTQLEGFLSITLVACEISRIVWWIEHTLVLPFLGIGMRIDLFQSCGHCWIFQIC